MRSQVSKHRGILQNHSYQKERRGILQITVIKRTQRYSSITVMKRDADQWIQAQIKNPTFIMHTLKRPTQYILLMAKSGGNNFNIARTNSQ
jgi:hypothetical protein